MPKLFCPRELSPGERRVAVTPDSARKLQALGLQCTVETGAGLEAGFRDADYEAAGVKISTDRQASLKTANALVWLRPPPVQELALLSPGVVTIGFLDPFRETQTVSALASAGVVSLSMEMIPRTTVAQKMDALSSQASLAGYASVLLAASRLDKILPMMMTPAGTLQPSRFLIIGVGVAGLQAIATAKRLGARVTAFDTRPVVEEQVKSLGARFLKIDLGETGQTEQGYAKELTPEQIELQRKGMAKGCENADAVITTAQVFGRPAPRILTASMLTGMRHGSVIIDLAVATGGNVEGSDPEREVVVSGVRILGAGNLPSTVPGHSSEAYANNVSALITHLWKPEVGISAEATNEIAAAAVITRGGEIVNERVKAVAKI